MEIQAFPVLSRGSSLDQPVTHQFSSTSHWLGIQNPPLEIWVTEEVKSIPRWVQNQIIQSSNSPQQFRPPSWCLPSPAWGPIVVRQNLPFRMDPSSSTGKCSKEYAENFTLIFPWGQPVVSEKLCFQAKPGKDLHDHEERPDVTFRELGSHTSRCGKEFLTHEIST
jgi:hypothetical protein